MNEELSQPQNFKTSVSGRSSMIPSFNRLDFSLWGMVGLLACTIFSFLVYATFNTTHPQWSRTDGVITDVSQGYKLTQVVEYKYQVNGHEYNAEEHFQMAGLFMWKGRPVVVKFDPTSPGFSAIQTGFGPATIVWGVLAALSGILTYTGFALAISPPRKMSESTR